VLNKPRDLPEARRCSARLSGRTHTVFTGLAVRRIRDGLQIDEGVASDRDFKPLDERRSRIILRGSTSSTKPGLCHPGAGELIVAGTPGRSPISLVCPSKLRNKFDAVRSPG